MSYYDLIENFLRKYFRIYDSVQRFYLRDFYHPSALYSMSISYDHAKITVANSVRINRYLARSRNLLKMANLSQSMTNLKFGNMAIVEYFVELPVTEHDLRSFKIDMTVANVSTYYTLYCFAFLIHLLRILHMYVLLFFSNLLNNNNIAFVFDLN